MSKLSELGMNFLCKILMLLILGMVQICLLLQAASEFKHRLKATRRRIETIRHLKLIEKKSPAIRYTKEMGCVKQPAPHECRVCFSEFQEGEEIRKLQCNHMYHKECLDNWFQLRPTCPLCRLKILPEDVVAKHRNEQSAAMLEFEVHEEIPFLAALLSWSFTSDEELSAGKATSDRDEWLDKAGSLCLVIRVFGIIQPEGLISHSIGKSDPAFHTVVTMASSISIASVSTENLKSKNNLTLLDLKRDYRSKLSSIEKEIVCLKAQVSKYLQVRHPLVTEHPSHSEIDLVRGIKLLQEKIEKLKKNCNELTEDLMKHNRESLSIDVSSGKEPEGVIGSDSLKTGQLGMSKVNALEIIRLVWEKKIAYSSATKSVLMSLGCVLKTVTTLWMPLIPFTWLPHCQHFCATWFPRDLLSTSSINMSSPVPVLQKNFPWSCNIKQHHVVLQDMARIREVAAIAMEKIFKPLQYNEPIGVKSSSERNGPCRSVFNACSTNIGNVSLYPKSLDGQF